MISPFLRYRRTCPFLNSSWLEYPGKSSQCFRPQLEPLNEADQLLIGTPGFTPEELILLGFCPEVSLNTLLPRICSCSLTPAMRDLICEFST